jgi:indole-3-glycerol phosphate synthase
MAVQIPDILARIVERKQVELAAKAMRAVLFEEGAARRTPRDFAAALSARTPAIIAEMKKASPSKGLLSADFRPAEQARDYESGGAVALSVLTDRDYFQGSLKHLQEARAAVALPVLRKDFTIDEIDIVEAASHGADAILLIAAILTREELERFRRRAESLGLAALVEVHDDAELDRALESGARILGVNNRDLRTFQVSLDTSIRLAPRIPVEVIRVSESGIHSREDVIRLSEAGYHAFLVGEHLMKSGRPADALRALLG